MTIIKHLFIFNFNKNDKTHGLFIKQVIVAVVLFACLSTVITYLFLKNPKSEDYIVSNTKVTNLRKSASEILNNLIETNSLTFDPTHGVSIKKVFENLKFSEKKKTLLLGSSQLVTLSDDWSL